MPICSVPSHRSPPTGLTASEYTLLPMLVELETLEALWPPLVETHAPLFGLGAQKPPHTMFPFEGNAQPVSAVAELKGTVEIALQLAPSLVDR